MARTRGRRGTTNGDSPSSVQIAIDERPAVGDRRRATIPRTEEGVSTSMAWLQTPGRACVPLYKAKRFVIIGAVEMKKLACRQKDQSQRGWPLRSLPPLPKKVTD